MIVILIVILDYYDFQFNTTMIISQAVRIINSFDIRKSVIVFSFSFLNN